MDVLGAVKNKAKDTANDLVGNIQHAVLCVYEKEATAISEEMKKSPSKGVLTPQNLVAYLPGGNQAAPSTKYIPIQFNPNTISFSARGGGFVEKTNFDANKNATITREAADVSIHMQITLIFDQVFNDDAFMADKFVVNPTNIAKGAVSAARRKEYSVQPQVEGLMATLFKKDTRLVTFKWGKMSYSGVINSVSSEYTMFSVSGKPIRANVTLGLILADKNTKGGCLGQWQDHYDAAFRVDGKNITNAKKTGQSAGNLLNISY